MRVSWDSAARRSTDGSAPAQRLLGQVVGEALVELLARKRRQVHRGGASGLLEVFDQVNRSLARSRAVRRLLEQAGRYSPPAGPETLAYAIVRLAEAFLYDAAIGIRGDHERLRAVEAAVLGVPVPPEPEAYVTLIICGAVAVFYASPLASGTGRNT